MLKNLNIQAKLLVLLAVFVIGLVGFGAGAYRTLDQLRVNGPLYHRIIEGETVLTETHAPILSLDGAYLACNMLVSDADQADDRDLAAGLKVSRQQYQEKHDEFAKTLAEGPLKEALLVRCYASAQDFLRVAVERLAPAVLRGDQATAKRIFRNELEPLKNRHQAALNEVTSLAERLNRENEAVAQRELQAGTLFLGVLCLSVLGVAVVLTLLISRNIVRPLGAVVEVAHGVAEGNLKQPKLEYRSSDETGQLARVFNTMVDNLTRISRETRAVTEELNASVAQILASTQQQASSTGEQAAAVQETTATMEEISQSGAQIADKAREVAASAEATSTASESGLLAVRGVRTSMEGIQDQAEAVAENIVTLSERTQAVGEIVASVNDIAEQSNLLALNAAIVAAAAGENGRSFAVVAAEMKNLADQCKEATVQVRSILGDIQKGINTSVMLTEEAVKRVDGGRQQVDVAERTLQELTESTLQSIHAFQQIVAATNQQQIGFEQVTRAVQNIRQAAEQNAVGTRQLEQASSSLSSLSAQLRTNVEIYQV